MNLDEIIGLIPEDKRETVKGELGQYVRIDGRETAEKLAKEHPHIKSVVDSFISKAVESHDQRFQAEKLPRLVESEILKMNPPKDPRDLELQKMRQELEGMKTQTLREKQTALAVAVAAEKGIPIDLAKRYIGNDDAETIANLESLTGPLMAWRDEAVKKEIAGRLGNNGAPQKGMAQQNDVRSLYEKAVADGNADLALYYKGKMQDSMK